MTGVFDMAKLPLIFVECIIISLMMFFAFQFFLYLCELHRHHFSKIGVYFYVVFTAWIFSSIKLYIMSLCVEFIYGSSSHSAIFHLSCLCLNPVFIIHIYNIIYIIYTRI